METKTKSLSGIEFVRHLMHVKEQTQREAVEKYQNDPEIQAAYQRLSDKNKETREGSH